MNGRIFQAQGHCDQNTVFTELIKLKVSNATHTGEALIGKDGHLLGIIY